jgi:hypothetical protein
MPISTGLQRPCGALFWARAPHPAVPERVVPRRLPLLRVKEMPVGWEKPDIRLFGTR